MNYLILLRHGQSHWNLENRFTGLKDVELSENGENEAKIAGKIIKKTNIKFDIIYTSRLKRAYNTAVIALKHMETSLGDNNLIRSELLNERDYGDLVGLNKSDTKIKYGEKQVQIWRRSYDVPPPGGESLKDVVSRVEIFNNSFLKKNINEENNVLISAHGNSLRAMFICLNIFKIEEISEIEIPTGKPFLIEFENKSLLRYKYLD
tara:strand:- start:24 stop:641 length:618 start_codon:yes stop_codon:yes gene_type:complete